MLPPLLESICLAVGVAVVFGLALFGLWVVAEVCYAAVVACSWMRWRVALCRAHGWRVKWRRAPLVLAEMTFEFFPYRRGAVTHEQPGYGAWYGVGDWYVAPPTPGGGL